MSVNNELGWAFSLAEKSISTDEASLAAMRKRRMWLSRGAVAFAVVVLCVAVLRELLANGPDSSPARTPTGAAAFAGLTVSTIAAAVSLALLTLAAALKWIGTPRYVRWSERSILAALTIALVPGLAFLFGTEAIDGATGDFATLAASAALIGLAVGILSAEPVGPLVAFLSGLGPGSTMIRRLLPQACLILLVVGTARAIGQHQGWFDWKTGFVGMMFASIGVVMMTMYRAAIALDKYATEQSRAEQSLREHELRYRLIVDATFDGIVISQNGFIKDANPGYASMFGYERSELIGRSVFDLVAEESRAMVTERIRGGQSGGYDVIGVRKDGSRFTFDTVVRVHGEGEHQIRVAALRDTTAQRKLEEQYRQSQKMEAVGRLAGGVAHDFNNLLTVILGHTEILIAESDEQSDDGRERVEQLKEVRDAGQNASQLTQQLLAFSRQQVLRKQPVSINNVVLSTEKLLRRLIGEDVQLNSVLDPDLWIVHADESQLSQVLMNLAVNARDAMPDGGTLLMETHNVMLDDEYVSQYENLVAGPYVQLCVSDSGVGMDESTQQRIFEPFFTTKDLGKGTGLGLASVYGIVQQSGGHIWLYSELGLGTTFKLYFPAVRDEVAQSSEVTLAESELHGDETVLIAEDATAVRQLATTVLQKHGYRVIVAENAQTALVEARASADPIHLLLTDVVMPGMNGRELAEALKKERPDMKVLFMSGYTNDAILQRGILESGPLLLQKPFTPTELARMVRVALGRA